jgi:hypothetical protein
MGLFNELGICALIFIFHTGRQKFISLNLILIPD